MKNSLCDRHPGFLAYKKLDGEVEVFPDFGIDACETIELENIYQQLVAESWGIA